MSNDLIEAKFQKSSARQQLIDIIEHFVKQDAIKEGYSDTNFWKREYFMAKFLIKKFGYENLVFLDLGFKVNSLVYFRSYEGIQKINKKLKGDYV